METDQPTQENSDTVDSDDQGTSQARSYECTFCKRGFSNAQALGGHMNIHRKDKAKLKKSSNETQQSSLDIPTMPTLYSPIPTNTIQTLMEAKLSQERSTIQWPWVFGQDVEATKRSDETRVGEVIKQLPLFAETPSNSDEQKPRSNVGDNAEKGLELDLELRLGPEPEQESSETTGTKKFF